MSWSNSRTRFVALGLAVCFQVALEGTTARATQQATAESVPTSLSRQGGEAEANASENLGPEPSTGTEFILGHLRQAANWVIQWYIRTPPADRASWGGLVGCAAFGLVVLFERLMRLRRHRIVPADFTARFLDRLHGGKLDCGAALDHCELNPSPAARIALAAVRRWGRPASDLERAVSLALRVETDHLRRNVGSLRRIAALAPLIGLLGTLFAAGRVLESIPAAAAPVAAAIESAQSATPAMAWGPAFSRALAHVCLGIVVATLALVAYDGLQSRIEKLTAALDRVGAETIDAIALAAPVSAPALPLGGPQTKRMPPVSSGDDNVGPRRPIPAPHHGQIRRDAPPDFSKRYLVDEAGF
jgi:biopolymer transport protein ExbB